MKHTYTISEDIIPDVRTAIDENASAISLSSMDDVETLDLDKLIKATIADAATAVESAVPIALLDNTKSLDVSDPETNVQVTWTDSTFALVQLPRDILRMCVLRFPSFKRPLYDFITADSPIYEMQHSRYGGVRGSAEQPVAAFVRKQGMAYLEVFTSGGNTDADNTDSVIGEYLPTPKVVEGKIELCERCYRAIIYRCAALIMVIYKDANAENMLKLSESMML